MTPAGQDLATQQEVAAPEPHWGDPAHRVEDPRPLNADSEDAAGPLVALLNLLSPSAIIWHPRGRASALCQLFKGMDQSGASDGACGGWGSPPGDGKPRQQQAIPGQQPPIYLSVWYEQVQFSVSASAEVCISVFKCLAQTGRLKTCALRLPNSLPFSLLVIPMSNIGPIRALQQRRLSSLFSMIFYETKPGASRKTKTSKKRRICLLTC